MKQFLHIIHYKILIFLKLNKVNNVFDLLKSTGTTVVYILFAIGAYYFTERAIGYLLIKQKLGNFLLHEFASMVMFIFFLSVNVGNIIVSYSTLFKSAEVDFLFSKPVLPGRLFIIKFLDNFFYSSSTLLAVLIALILGYTSYFHLDLLTIFCIIFLNFLPFMFSAASLGVIILMVVIRLSSRYGIKPVLYCLAGLYLASLVFFFNSISPISLVSDVFKHYPELDRYFGNLIPPYIKLLPNNWLSESLYWIVMKDYQRAIPFFIYQMLLSISLFTAASNLGNRWYYRTWLLMPAIKSRKQKKDVLSKIISFEKKSRFDSQADAMIKKDILLFLREPSQVILLLILLLLILLFMTSVSSLSHFAITDSYLRAIIFLSILVFNVLLISTLSLRFIFPLVSLEGLSFWKIHTSPIELKKYILLKLLSMSVLIFLLSQMLSYFSNRHYPKELGMLSGLIIFFISLALIFMNFGMGCIFVNYKEKNPIRISSSQGASLSFLLSVVYMIFLISVLYVRLYSYFEIIRNNTHHHHLFSFFTAPILIIGAVSVVISIVFYSFSLKALKRDF